MNPNNERRDSVLSEIRSADAALDAQIVRALGRVPRVNVPADFASTVTRRAFAQSMAKPSFLAGWGSRIALACGALATVAMFALAPHAAPTLTSVPFDAELLLLAELGALSLFANRLPHE